MSVVPRHRSQLNFLDLAQSTEARTLGPLRRVEVEEILKGKTSSSAINFELVLGSMVVTGAEQWTIDTLLWLRHNQHTICMSPSSDLTTGFVRTLALQQK